MRYTQVTETVHVIAQGIPMAARTMGPERDWLHIAAVGCRLVARCALQAHRVLAHPRQPRGGEMLRMVESNYGTIRDGSPQNGKLRVGGKVHHAAEVSGGWTLPCPQVSVAGRAVAIGNRGESIRALVLVVTGHTIRRMYTNFVTMMNESLVATDAGLVQGHVGKFLVGSDQALNRLPWSTMTICAVESVVDLVDRGGRMDVMWAEPCIVCNPGDRDDHSKDKRDDRGVSDCL